MHPYRTLPDRHFWRRFVSDTSWRDLPFMDAPKFTLQAGDRLATAGSCFAQHITRYMKRSGLEPFVAEAAHPFVQAADPARTATISRKLSDQESCRRWRTFAPT